MSECNTHRYTIWIDQLKESVSQAMRQSHEILDARRRSLGLTYEDVHEKLEEYAHRHGIKVPAIATVGHWFNGTRRPRGMEHLKALCDVLGLSVDEVVGQRPIQAQTDLQQVILSGLNELDEEQQQLVAAMVAGLRRSK